MEFFFKGRSYILEQGDSAYFDSDIPHSGKSVGNKKAKLLIVIYSYKRLITGLRFTLGKLFVESYPCYRLLTRGDTLMTVLLTGGAGLIGSDLARTFLKQRYESRHFRCGNE